MIKLDDIQIEILGKPNFACAAIAKLLIAAAVYEDKAQKAEYEQAVFIHWAMALYEKHGDKWRAAAKVALAECHQAIEDQEKCGK